MFLLEVYNVDNNGYPRFRVGCVRLNESIHELCLNAQDIVTTPQILLKS